MLCAPPLLCTGGPGWAVLSDAADPRPDASQLARLSPDSSCSPGDPACWSKIAPATRLATCSACESARAPVPSSQERSLPGRSADATPQLAATTSPAARPTALSRGLKGLPSLRILSTLTGKSGSSARISFASQPMA